MNTSDRSLLKASVCALLFLMLALCTVWLLPPFEDCTAEAADMESLGFIGVLGTAVPSPCKTSHLRVAFAFGEQFRNLNLRCGYYRTHRSFQLTAVGR